MVVGIVGVVVVAALINTIVVNAVATAAVVADVGADAGGCGCDWLLLLLCLLLRFSRAG